MFSRRFAGSAVRIGPGQIGPLVGDVLDSDRESGPMDVGVGGGGVALFAPEETKRARRGEGAGAPPASHGRNPRRCPAAIDGRGPAPDSTRAIPTGPSPMGAGNEATVSCSTAAYLGLYNRARNERASVEP
ncbi:hypothetical protein NL676_002204 [Syzygium grande]|nr:hypothetical protein NL676_002204 [Syzygium grande]